MWPDFSSLRMDNLFGNYEPEDPYSGIFSPNRVRRNPYGDLFPYQVPQPTNEDDVTTLMRSMYNPEHTATDRFNQLMTQYPVREEPSTLRKIGAMVMGAGKRFKPEDQERVMHPHFEEKLLDWKNQMEPAYQAANLERYSNANDRQIAYQTAQAQINQRKLDETIRNNTARNENAANRTDIYEWKTKHPRAEVYKQPNGNVYLVDPVTHEYYDTGLASNLLGDEQKIVKTGEQARETAKVRGQEARSTKSTPSGSVSKTGELPTQQKVREYNKARQLASMPEFKDFVILGTPGTNDFELTKPESHWYGNSGPTQDQYDRMYKFIYGGGAGYVKPGETVKTPTGRRWQQNQSTGQKRYSDDGGKTWHIYKEGQ